MASYISETPPELGHQIPRHESTCCWDTARGFVISFPERGKAAAPEELRKHVVGLQVTGTPQVQIDVLWRSHAASATSRFGTLNQVSMLATAPGRGKGLASQRQIGMAPFLLCDVRDEQTITTGVRDQTAVA